ncbi:MAG: HEAT repeat domain-containing protein [Phycisphaerae bacterium]|nr:HEAT repeat domain-containing protein [Phycisphaerae bacterium]
MRKTRGRTPGNVSSGEGSSDVRRTPLACAAIVAGLGLASLVGCASTSDGEWSSKSQSMSGNATPTRVSTSPVPSRSNATRAAAAPTSPQPASDATKNVEPVAAATPAPQLTRVSTEPARPSTGTQPVPATSFASAPAAPSATSLTLPVPMANDATSLRAAAIAVCTEASRSTWPLLRANAIEALTQAPAAFDANATRGLIDENRGVRFVAAFAIARLKRCDLAHLVEPLLRDSSNSVEAAAITALAVCDQRVNQAPLAAMVRSDSTEVRANAYWAIGIIGNRSAIGLVRDSVGRGLPLTDPVRVRIVELQAAECLVRLGEMQEIEPIRAALFAPVEQGELTVLACQMVARLKDERSRPMLERLLSANGDQARPPEIRVAAIDALGRLGSSDRSILRSLLDPYLSAPEAGVRAQAAIALGSIGAASGLDPLSRLLSDPEPTVQVAAANAILVLTANVAASNVAGHSDREQ